MKKTMIYLNSMKSRCFMLVACVILVLGVTSCNNNDFESIAPDEQKELSNAELIEQALSRIPQTRANPPFPVVMVTEKQTVTVQCLATEDIVINWGDYSTTQVMKNTSVAYTHTYSGVQPPYVIFLQASNQAIKKLYVYGNELTSLDVKNNTELEYLDCIGNHLPALDLTGCSNLKEIWASGNNLSSIDVSHLLHLELLLLHDNQLTDIDLSKNLNLHRLEIGYNQITDLDLVKNTALKDISLSGLSVNTINNLPINSTSFAVFSQLERLDISRTPFTVLDLSSNPLVSRLDISGTAITQLDISNLQIEVLIAAFSDLTNLIYTPNSLLYAYELNLRDTPFEMLQSNLISLFTSALPDRNMPCKNGQIMQGRMQTNSSQMLTPWLPYLTGKNWVVIP